MKENVDYLKATLNSLHKSVEVMSKEVKFILESQRLMNPLCEYGTSYTSPEFQQQMSRYIPQGLMSHQAGESSNFPGISTLQQEPGILTVQSSAGEQALTTSVHEYQVPTSSAGTQEQALASLLSNKPSTSAEHLEETYHFLSQSELSQVFMKNMAVLLTRCLFSKTVRIASNESGRKKQQLDPMIMGFIRRKVFNSFQAVNVIHQRNGQSA